MEDGGRILTKIIQVNLDKEPESSKKFFFLGKGWMSRLHHAWQKSHQHQFTRNKSINRLSAYLSESIPKHVHKVGS